MLEISVTAETAASPDCVLALAGTDFSEHRAKIWPNVTTRRLEVHERGATYAVVTEGATGIARFAWERSRYDWSVPGTVTQIVLDSNVLASGSSWDRVAPTRSCPDTTPGSSAMKAALRMSSSRALRRITPAANLAWRCDGGRLVRSCVRWVGRWRTSRIRS